MIQSSLEAKQVSMALFDELPYELRRFVDNTGVDIATIYNRWKDGVDPAWILITEKQSRQLNQHVSISKTYGLGHPDLRKIAMGELL